MKASDGGASKKAQHAPKGALFFQPAFNLVKMINFNIRFRPFLVRLFRADSRVVIASPREPDVAFGVDKFFASLLYNFLKLLVSRIIISHFHKISLNG